MSHFVLTKLFLNIKERSMLTSGTSNATWQWHSLISNFWRVCSDTSGNSSFASEWHVRNFSQNGIVLARNTGNVVLQVLDPGLDPDPVQARGRPEVVSVLAQRVLRSSVLGRSWTWGRSIVVDGSVASAISEDMASESWNEVFTFKRIWTEK